MPLPDPPPVTASHDAFVVAVHDTFAVTASVSPLAAPFPTFVLAGVISNAAGVPVPWIAKLYGFSSPSSLAMLIVALRNPVPAGSNVTWKIVAPSAATGVVGCVVTVNSAACAPPTTTLGVPVRFSAALPAFVMAYVRTTVPPVSTAAPKSVWSARLGVASPSAIETAFPCTSISGAATTYPTAAGALRMPKPESRSTPAASISQAVLVRACRICAGVVKPRAIISAAIPAAWGAAAEVP